ncbi:MAG: hypothetical protein ACO2ON_01675 [Candidatus Nanopusillus sp.]
MSFLKENFRNIVLSHILDFEISYVTAKTHLTTDTIQELKRKILMLLFDYYNIVSLFENDERIKKEKFDSIKQFEDTILKLPIYWDSLDEIRNVYTQIIKRINEYLFKEET